MRILTNAVLLAAIAGITSACGSDDEEGARSCSVELQAGCDNGTVCEAVDGGEPGCFAPLVLRGRVVEAESPSTGIAGAIVVARDANGALVSRGTSITDGDGRYELAVPATRSGDGRPLAPAATLRADASGRATFPSGLRVALPVTVDSPENAGDRWVIENDTTDVALDVLPNSDDLATIRGVVRATDASGTLVVAGAASGIASNDGTFTIFNAPAGSVEVRGFKAGLALNPVQIQVSAGAEMSNITLSASGAPLATVSGDVSFVNASGHETSVVLVVASTFNIALARGETPIGLRQFPVTGQYVFSDVPAGEYVVLAAFENDELVRDPDASIGGTAVQHISVDSAAVDVPGFKITGALSVRSPGADGPEIVTATPTFSWADDSSEDGYELSVYDNFGNLVHHDADVARVSGSADVSVPYSGPTLSPGYYQFRAVSYRLAKAATGERTYISATEDLKGVFVVP